MAKFFSKFNKSQVGIFVVIASIIILIGVFFFSVNFETINLFSDQKSSYKVRNYVESCIDLKTKEAINKIGLSSGWLYSPPINYINKDTNEVLIKNGKGFDFFGVKMPYWYYYDDLNEVFKKNIPEFDSEDRYSIRNQIKTYLDENLEKNCINNFKSFKDVLKIVYDSNKIKSKVVFDKGDIVVSLELPLEIIDINNNVTEFIDTFEIETENKIKIPYYLAIDIVESESKSYFIEKRLLQFLTPYMSIEGRDLLPPYYDFKMIFDFEPWKVPKVKKLTKQILSENIDLIQFYGTVTNERTLPENLENNEFAKGVYSSYNKDYLSENSVTKENNPKIFRQYKDYNIKTNFEYFYPLSFNLAPSMGNLFLFPKTEAALGILPIFFTTYTTVYEMHMPIVFEIRDTKNKNDDFVFNLAVEANIDYNGPLAEKRELEYDPNILPDIGSSLICDPNQFVSKDVYLEIFDPIENGNRKKGDPIKGVDEAIVTFDCKGLSTCFIGQTEINGEYISRNYTRLKFRLPIDCSPGKLEVSKFGYKKLIFENVNPNLNNEIDLGKVKMYSLKSMILDINILKSSDSKYSAGRSLRKNESGFLIMTNLDDEDLTQVVEFNRENKNDLEVKLMPGNYSLEGFIIDEKDLVIPSQEFCYDKGSFQGKDCKTIEGFTAESWVTGNLKISKTEFSFRDIFYRDKIVVNIIDLGRPTSYDDMKNMDSDIEGVSQGKKPYFEKD